MRTALAIALVLAGVASVAAQDYQSPVPPMPPGMGMDTSAAKPAQTPLPPPNTSATAQTPPATEQTPPASANTQQK
jgi:hypothetical protein